MNPLGTRFRRLRKQIDERRDVMVCLPLAFLPRHRVNLGSATDSFGRFGRCHTFLHPRFNDKRLDLFPHSKLAFF